MLDDPQSAKPTKLGNRSKVEASGIADVKELHISAQLIQQGQIGQVPQARDAEPANMWKPAQEPQRRKVVIETVDPQRDHG